VDLDFKAKIIAHGIVTLEDPRFIGTPHEVITNQVARLKSEVKQYLNPSTVGNAPLAEFYAAVDKYVIFWRNLKKRGSHESSNRSKPSRKRTKSKTTVRKRRKI
jgi:hypothetical protein